MRSTPDGTPQMRREGRAGNAEPCWCTHQPARHENGRCHDCTGRPVFQHVHRYQPIRTMPNWPLGRFLARFL